MAAQADTGFPTGSDFRSPDEPDLGGLLRDPESGRYRFPREHAIDDDWARVNEQAGLDRGCCCECVVVPQPEVPGAAEFTDPGDAGNAVLRAAQKLGIVRNVAPAELLTVKRCATLDGSLRVNLAKGNLLAQ